MRDRSETCPLEVRLREFTDWTQVGAREGMCRDSRASGLGS